MEDDDDKDGKNSLALMERTTFKGSKENNLRLLLIWVMKIEPNSSSMKQINQACEPWLVFAFLISFIQHRPQGK